MKRNILAIAAVFLLGTTPLTTAAQETRPALVGLLVVDKRDKPVQAFRQGLRQLGYVEEKNLILEFRSARGKVKRLPALARELVALNPDVIVTHSTPGVRSVRRATGAIPIVMASVGNAVERGFVASVAKPGGNVTGNSFFGAEMAVKRIGILKEALPSLSRMALLAHPSYPAQARQRAAAAARSLGMEVQIHYANGPAQFEPAFVAMKQQRAEGLHVLASPVFHANRLKLVDYAERYGMPTIFPWRAAAEKGGLISYGPDLAALFRRAAHFVDRILRGANPAVLPVERPTKFEMVVNLKTARGLGIAFPPSILLRADKVIE